MVSGHSVLVSGLIFRTLPVIEGVAIPLGSIMDGDDSAFGILFDDVICAAVISTAIEFVADLVSGRHGLNGCHRVSRGAVRGRDIRVIGVGALSRCCCHVHHFLSFRVGFGDRVACGIFF